MVVSLEINTKINNFQSQLEKLVEKNIHNKTIRKKYNTIPSDFNMGRFML